MSDLKYDNCDSGQFEMFGPVGVTGSASDSDLSSLYYHREGKLRDLLCRERTRQKKSRKWVSRYSSVPERLIGEMERNEREFTLEVAWKIAFALGLDFDDVMREMNVPSFWPGGNHKISREAG